MIGAYWVDRKRLIDSFNETLATEIVCILRYRNHYNMATGINADPVAQEFLQHANEEELQTDWVSVRLYELGGKLNWKTRQCRPPPRPPRARAAGGRAMRRYARRRAS